MNNMDFRRGANLPSSVDLTGDEASFENRVDESPPVLTHYLRIARRRKWLILSAIVLAVAAGLIITLLMTPLFKATTTLEIQRENINIVKMEDVERETGSADQEFYQTQYGLLKARSLADRVASDLKLGDSQRFFEMFDAPQAETWFSNGRVLSRVAPPQDRVRLASDILLANITVNPIRSSRLVEVQFESPDPNFSAQVVNAWAANYIKATLERRFEATSYARTFLESRLGQLRQRLDTSERALVSYASRQGIINLPGGATAANSEGERSIVSEDLIALNRELGSATADRVRAESRLGGGAESLPEVVQNGTISGLRQRRAELAGEYSKLLVQFEPEYPSARALKSQIDQLDVSIAREEGRVKGTLRETFQSSANREAKLQQNVNGLKSDLLDLRRRSIQYNIYQRDVDTNRQLYDGLLQRYKEIGVAGGVGVNNISIVDLADVPQNPSSPRLMLNVLIALLAGVALGGALALAAEQIDEAIADPTEVERALNLPMLGAIPMVADADPMEALRDRKSPASEAYLSVQTSLAFSTDHGIPRSLAVTSTRPGEGKTTTSFAVASSLARTGRRVLLIDGDMRSPSVHHMFGSENERGLSNYLSGDDEIAQMVSETGSAGLSMMTAGPQPPNAAELLTSDRLSRLVTSLLDQFDVIIFDAPPVMGLADAPLLGSQVEGVIFVVESHGTRSSMARVAVRRLQAANARLTGAVLTKFETDRARYGYGYDYGYGYGRSSKTAA